MRTTGMDRGVLGLIALSVVACTTSASPEREHREDALGIARFEIEETADRSSVIGLDEAGAPVARLDLVHGRFALTGQFKDDYDTADVDGRKLDVTIHGAPRLVWETAGYAPTLHLPAHPPSEVDVATFLASPQAKAVLDRWQIAFEASAGAEFGNTEEIAFGAGGATSGTNGYSCLSNNPNTQCGTARTFTINTCGGGVVPMQALRVTRTTPYNEYFINQCCPAGSGGQSTDWFAGKSCPTTGSGAQPSTCGTTGSTVACKSCPGYPSNAAAACSLQLVSPGIQYCYENNNDLGTCVDTYVGQPCAGPLPRQNMCSCSCTCTALHTYGCVGF